MSRSEVQEGVVLGVGKFNMNLTDNCNSNTTAENITQPVPTKEAKTKKDNDSSKESQKLRSTAAQIVATLAFSGLLMGIGVVLSMPTIVIGSLLRKESDEIDNFTLATTKEEFTLRETDASWFGSIIFISQPIGSIISGFLQDSLGRKRCMMLVNIPQFIGLMMIYYSSNIIHLYLAGIILGLSIGFMEAPTLSYIGEISEPRLRGILSLLAGSSAGIGCLLEFCIGALFHWRTTLAISAGVPVFAFITMSLIPDSPTWLICKGRISEAEQALCWLRGWVHPVCVRDEFLSLLEYTKSPGVKEVRNLSINSTHESKSEKPSNKHDAVHNMSVSETFALLLQPKLYRPLRLVLLFFFIAHSVSLIGVRPFMVPVFESIGMPLKAHYVLVLVGTLQIVGGLVGMVFMKLLGKRKVTTLSLLPSVACCFIISALIAFKEFTQPWVPLTFFCILFFTSGFGVCPLPWVLLSEVFPLDGRGIAGGISAAVSYFLAFILTKTYINCIEWFDIHGTILLYGFIGLAGFVYLHYNLPETEGKTLAEIETYFVSDGKENQTNKNVFV